MELVPFKPTSVLVVGKVQVRLGLCSALDPSVLLFSGLSGVTDCDSLNRSNHSREQFHLFSSLGLVPFMHLGTLPVIRSVHLCHFAGLSVHC